MNGLTSPSARLLTITFINELDQIQQPFILVLDDCHLIREPMIHNLLNKLLVYPPRAMHMVLIGRKDPPVKLMQLRARKLVNEIRARDLRFTVGETAEFLTLILGHDVKESTAIFFEEKTEGWVTSLHLAALSMRQRGRDENHLIKCLSGENRYIWDYLVSEVLHSLSPPTRRFLIKTSILNRLKGALCHAVVGPDESERDGQTYLDWLHQMNLFIVPLDDKRQWYRYHHLFQDLLQQRLQRGVDTGELASLHLRAGTWFRQEGYIEEAVGHFLAAGDLPAAAETVEEQLQVALNREERLRIERWLGFLPEDLIWQRPLLLVARSWTLHWQFRLSAYEPFIDRAVELTEAQFGPDQLSESIDQDEIRGQINALRSQMLYFTSDFSGSLISAEKAVRQLPRSSRFVKSFAEFYRALCRQALGQGDQTIRELDMMLDRQSQCDVYNLRLLLAKAFALLSLGQLQQLEGVAHQLRNASTTIDMRLSIAWAYYHLGLLHYEWNKLDLSTEHLSRVVDLRYHAHLVAYRDALACLALTHQAQGFVEESDAILLTLSEFVQGLNNQVHYAAFHAIEARLWLQRGDVEAAARAIARVDTKMALQPMLTFDIPQLTMIRVLIAQGTKASLAAADRLLDELYRYVYSTHNVRFQIVVGGLRALQHEAQGHFQEALAELEKAVKLAQPGGFVRTFVDLGPVMATLLRHLALRGVARAYITKILAAFPEPEQQILGTMQAILLEPLTDQELRVLKLIQSRLSNREIADELVISPNTVKKHTIHIYKKLNVNNRKRAVAQAELIGLLTVS